MSTITRRNSAARDGGSIDQRIARVLDQAGLAEVVPHLPAELLHQLVQRRGLADSGELLVVATPAQLVALADVDLWQRPAPGRDERFDVARFGAWIEALVDVTPEDAARTVATLDPGIVVAGLSRYVRVFDPGIFEPVAQSDDEAIARHDAMREGDAIGVDANDWRDDRIECEVGGYLVRARRPEAWDAIVDLLAALHEQHAPAFHRLMRGCRALSNSRPEANGFHDLLEADEQFAFDLDTAREARRTAQGYATPADARAFLALARRGSTGATDAIAAAYLRTPDDADGAPPPAAAEPAHPTPSAETIAELTALLNQGGDAPESVRGRLMAGDAAPSDAAPRHLARLMAEARTREPIAFTQRTRELAFLANVLAAGGSVQGRPFTAAEASEAASGICNLGLESAGDLPDTWLVDHTLVAAFTSGWSIQHRDVSLFAADRVVDVLGDLQCDDAELQRDLAGLRQALRRHRAADTPWLARGRADALAMLDPLAAVAVQGLLSECPIVASALTAVVDGQVSGVDPNAFHVIATRARIGEIRLFLRMLPALLTG
jgi:hypothetical protein